MSQTRPIEIVIEQATGSQGALFNPSMPFVHLTSGTEIWIEGNMGEQLQDVCIQNGDPTESVYDDGEEFGVLVDPENPIDVANGLLRLLRSETEWLKFQAAGMARVLVKYTWQQTAK